MAPPKIETQLRRAAKELGAAEGKRDALIVRAASEGLSYRRIASLVGLTYGRVGQIVRRNSH